LLYILIFSFSTADETTECSGLNGVKHYQNPFSPQFPPHSLLMFYCRSQIFAFWHIFKPLVCYFNLHSGDKTQTHTYFPMRLLLDQISF
jgi:hypothetical protein